MRRITAILLAIVFIAALLCACDDTKPDPDASTAEPTEKATEKAADDPTDAPTDVPTEASEPADSTFVYTDPSGAYQLDVPERWNDTGMIVAEENEGYEIVAFVYKDAYEQGAGRVFTIVKISDAANITDVSELPHAEELYNDGTMQVFVNYPTDVQFAPYDEPGSAESDRQYEEYRVLSEMRDGIIGSFRICE